MKMVKNEKTNTYQVCQGKSLEVVMFSYVVA
jgi:hypothetical protein